MPSISVFIFLSPSLCFCPSFPDSLSLCLFSLWVCLCVSVSVSLSLCLCLLISVSLSPSLSFWVSVLMSPWLYVCISLSLNLSHYDSVTMSKQMSKLVKGSNTTKLYFKPKFPNDPNFKSCSMKRSSIRLHPNDPLISNRVNVSRKAPLLLKFQF